MQLPHRSIEAGKLSSLVNSVEGYFMCIIRLFLFSRTQGICEPFKIDHFIASAISAHLKDSAEMI